MLDSKELEISKNNFPFPPTLNAECPIHKSELYQCMFHTRKTSTFNQKISRRK